jgi:hypothetical protein
MARNLKNMMIDIFKYRPVRKSIHLFLFLAEKMAKEQSTVFFVNTLYFTIE